MRFGWSSLVVASAVALLAGSGCSSCIADPGAETGDNGSSGTGNTGGDGGVAASGGSSSGSTSGSSAAGSGTVGSSVGVASSVDVSSAGSPSSAGVSSAGASSSTVDVSSGAPSSGATSAGVSVVFTAPANNGATVTVDLPLNQPVRFDAAITDAAGLNTAGIAWTLTDPTGAVTQPAGSLLGSTASLTATPTAAGTWSVAVAYTSASGALASAQHGFTVYSNLPPQLAWVAPANNGTTVTAPHKVATPLPFQAALTDDAPLVAQSVVWTHTPPSGVPVTSQGTFSATGANSANLAFVPALDTAGTHRVKLDYTDGTTPRALELSVNVVADLPPTAVFLRPDSTNGVANDGALLGDVVTFEVRVADDFPVVAQNASFLITPPSGAAVTNQGSVAANGTSANASVAVTLNAAGTWTVTWRYTDVGGNSISVSVQVVVAQDPAPVVRILQPVNDGTVAASPVVAGAALQLRGRVSDNAPITAQNVQWTFTPASGVPQQGQGTLQPAGGNAVNTTLDVADVGSAGTAQVQLRYTDAVGTTTTATVQLTVLPAGSPLVVAISPQPNAQERVGRLVTFRANVSDDAPIVAANLTWTLQSPGGASQTLSGSFAAAMNANTGSATLAATLVASGTWTALVRYTDATGLSGQALFTVQAAANQPPTCAFVPPPMCLTQGDVDLQVQVNDPDGDTPVAVTLGSSNPADGFANRTFNTMGGTRTITVTLTGAGMRTLSCGVVDDAGLAGTTALLSVNAVTAPTVTLNASSGPVASGQPQSFSVASTADVVGATVTVVDSVEGPQVVVMGAGSVGTPRLGFHDLVATVVDACGGVATDTVRYAVTQGGAAASTLGNAELTNTSVRTSVLDPVDGFILLAAGNGLQRLDPTSGTALAYQPNQLMAGTSVAGAVVDMSLGAADGLGNRREAYATGNGVFLCTNLAMGMVDTCRRFTENGDLQNNDVRAVLMVGSGAGDGSLLVVGTPDGLQVLFGNGQERTRIPEGNDPDEIRGTVQDLALASPATQGVLGGARLWVATDSGVSLVTFAAQGNGVASIQHFDDRHAPPVCQPSATCADWLPDYNVRAIALDPLDATVAWFGTDDGVAVNRGPGTGIAQWTSYPQAALGLAAGSVRALAVEHRNNASAALVWGGTSEGAFRLDASGAAPLVTPLTTEDGLPSNDVRSVVIPPSDPAFTKWFGTAAGVWAYVGL